MQLLYMYVVPIDSKLYHMGRELDPNFLKLSYSLGNPPHMPPPPHTTQPQGENIDRCFMWKNYPVI